MGEVVVIPTPLPLKIVVAEWVSGNRSQVIHWEGIDDYDVVGHRIKRQNPTLSDEIYIDTEWGTLYHLIQMVSGSGAAFLPLIVGDLE